MKLRRLEPINFELPTGFVASVPPLTRGQMRSLYALESKDPEKIEAPMDASELRARRMEVIFERAICRDGRGEVVTSKMFLEMLTNVDEIDIINGVIAHHNGIDVAYAVDLQAALRESLKKKMMAKDSEEKSS